MTARLARSGEFVDIDNLHVNRTQVAAQRLNQLVAVRLDFPATKKSFEGRPLGLLSGTGLKVCGAGLSPHGLPP